MTLIEKNPTVIKVIKPKKKVTANYVDNAKLYTAMLHWKRQCEENHKKGLDKPRVPEYVGESIVKIANHLSTRGNFVNYSFRDDMAGEGILNCFHGDTKFITLEYGPIELSKVVGQTVTVKARDGLWRPAQVKSYGKQMLYEVGFGSRGKQISHIHQKVIVTSNHRWFVTARLNKRNNLIPCNNVVTDLRIGDYIDNSPSLETMENKGVLHGIVFGDDSGHKTFPTRDRDVVIQGNRYASIRICKQDVVYDEMVHVLTELGYTPSFPPSANGDPVYFLGRMPYVKDLPFTTDPSYIKGFIHGWWLADGSKTHTGAAKLISTTNKEAVDWFNDYAAYAGFHVTGIRETYRKPNDGSYANGKTLFTISFRSGENYEPRVRYIEEHGEDEVYCVEEPVTNGFVLANGILTGNCIKYIDNFDPDNFRNPFAYFSQVIWFAFIRYIKDEKKQAYVKQKSLQNAVINGVLSEYQESDSDQMGMIDLDSDYMSSVVEDFEKKLEEKKKAKKKNTKK